MNLPSLDPLTRDSTLFEYTRGPLNVRVHANKMTIVGVSKLQVKAVRYAFRWIDRFRNLYANKISINRTKITDGGMSAEIDSFFPSMAVTGDYQSDNNYEGLQFKSSGKFNISLSKWIEICDKWKEDIYKNGICTADLSTTEKMSGRFVDRDGEKFYELEHFDLDVAMEDFKFFADGIFPDPELSESHLDIRYFAEILNGSMFQPVW